MRERKREKGRRALKSCSYSMRSDKFCASLGVIADGGEIDW